MKEQHIRHLTLEDKLSNNIHISIAMISRCGFLSLLLLKEQRVKTSTVFHPTLDKQGIAHD